MTSDYTSAAAEVAEAMDAVYENKQTNKKNNISGDFSTDNVSYPTVKATKNYVDSEIDAVEAEIPTKTSDLTNDSGFITQHQSLANYIQKSSTSGLVKNDGTIDTSTYLTEHQSLNSKTVTVEKQATAESGYSATYVVKQGGSQVGSKINIPKDFLVKSGQLKTCTQADTPVSGYVVGDKYLDFVINSKDSSATDEHMYILVSDLVEDTTYVADGTTLQLSGNTFSIKNGGVDTAQLKGGAVTSDKIASAVKNTWLSTSDVQSEISAFASALAEAINPSS